MMFDRSVLRDRPALAGADFLYAHAVAELVDRLALVSRTFSRGLAVAPPTPGVRAALAAPLSWRIASPVAALRPDVTCDVAMPFHRSFDLALSVGDLHLTDDPVRGLGEMRGVLKPDGLFLGAVLSSGTLAELTDALIEAESQVSDGASMRVAPFADVRKWGDGLARAGFALPVTDEGRLTVRYKNIDALFADLKTMGLRKVLAVRRPAHKRLFKVAEEIYRARHMDTDGRIKATFAFAYLSGWAPDPSQQRPARRGSATVRLADALKDQP